MGRGGPVGETPWRGWEGSAASNFQARRLLDSINGPFGTVERDHLLLLKQGLAHEDSGSLILVPEVKVKVGMKQPEHAIQ